MHKNTLVAGVGGFVVACALAGLVYLMVLKPDPRREPKPTPEREEPRPRPRATPKRSDAFEVQRLERPAVPSQPTAAIERRPTTTGSFTDRIAQLLARYDELMNQVTGPNALSLSQRQKEINAIVDELASMGPVAVEALLAALQRDAQANNTTRQMIVVRALGQIGGPEAIRALQEVLSSSQWGIQMAAVAQLSTLGPDGMRALRERVLTEPDFRVRGAILKYLGSDSDPASLRLIADLARRDPDPNVRRAAIRSLTMQSDPEAIRTLEDLARIAEDVTVRQAAIQGYAQARGNDSVLLLEQLVQSDPNLRVKSVAILGLQVVGTDDAVRVLQQTADDPSQTADVRARARGALAAIERTRTGAAPPGAQGKLNPVQLKGGLKPLKPIGQ